MLKTKTIEIGPDRSIHAVQAGKGPDLVLLHGALTTHSDWLEGPFDALARRFRVTALDRPGHGLSRRPRFEGAPRDQAAQIADGLDALGVGPAIVVGHSMGGLVALALAESFGKHVAALVLVAPLAFPELRLIEQAVMGPRAFPLIGPLISRMGQATIDRPMVKMAQRMMFAPLPVPPEWEANYPYDQILTSAAMVSEGEETIAVAPFAPAGTMDFSALGVDVQILIGTADQVANPMRHARPLAALLPEARLTEIEGVGHMLHHAAPDRVVEAALAARVFA